MLYMEICVSGEYLNDITTCFYRLLSTLSLRFFCRNITRTKRLKKIFLLNTHSHIYIYCIGQFIWWTNCKRYLFFLTNKCQDRYLGQKQKFDMFICDEKAAFSYGVLSNCYGPFMKKQYYPFNSYRNEKMIRLMVVVYLKTKNFDFLFSLKLNDSRWDIDIGDIHQGPCKIEHFKTSPQGVHSNMFPREWDFTQFGCTVI